jgi:hypothetical protein
MGDFLDDLNNSLFDYDGNGKVDFWDDSLRESQKKLINGHSKSTGSSYSSSASNHRSIFDETVPSKKQQKEEMLEKIRSRKAEINAHVIDGSTDTIEENETEEEYYSEPKTQVPATAYHSNNSYTKKPKSYLKALIIILLIIGIVSIPIIISAIKNRSIDAKYNQAVELVFNGQFFDADTIFTRLYFDDCDKKNYKDTWAFIMYCDAHQAYDRNDEDYDYSLFIRRDFRYLTDEQKAVVDEFRDAIEVLEKEREEYLKQPHPSEYPFVGMLESDLSYCSALKNYTVRKTETTIFDGGKIESNRRNANVYDYYANGRRYYEITCVYGKVYKINDLVVRSGYAEGLTSGNTTRRHYIEDDPYDVDEYADAEEFYYWHPDDFADYEDAEDYYNDNY